MAVIAVGPDGQAAWEPTVAAFDGPVRELKYLLRAYDAENRFDETTTQPLWLVRETDSEAPLADLVAEPEAEEPIAPLPQELLSGYGENELAPRDRQRGSRRPSCLRRRAGSAGGRRGQFRQRGDPA